MVTSISRIFLAIRKTKTNSIDLTDPSNRYFVLYKLVKIKDQPYKLTTLNQSLDTNLTIEVNKKNFFKQSDYLQKKK